MRYLYIFALCSSIAMAESLKGYIGLATGYLEDQNNFSDHSNNHTIYSLDTKPKEFSRYLALPSMDLNYYGFYIKTDLQDDFGIQGGYSFAENSSIFALTNGFGLEHQITDDIYYKIKQTKNDMFVNPYVVNANRAKKEATTKSVEVMAENILQVLALEYQYSDLDIEDEVNADAKQSGTTHNLTTMAYVIPFTDYIFGGIGVTTGVGDFDGDSNDYRKLGYNYRMMMELGKHQLQLEISKSNYDFDTANSYFGKIRDEKEEFFMLMYMKENFLDSSDMFLNTIFMKQSVDSNIDFFDKEMKAVMINVGWKF